MRILLIILLLLTNIFANQELEKVSLQLKWKYHFQFAGFIIAKEKGFYQDVGLDVQLKEFEPKMNIIKDVEDGISEFGIGDSALVYNALKGESVVGVMPIFQHSPFVLIGLKSSGIQDIRDINGKTIALYKGLDGIAIRTMLKSNDITFKELPPEFSIDKLVAKKIDLMSAYISNEPYQMKLKKIPIVTFSPDDYGFEGYGDILFTSKKMLKNNPKIVKKFYEASKKGWRYAFEHIDEAVDIIYKRYNTLEKTKDALMYEANELKKLSGYKENFAQFNYEKVKSIAQLFNLINGTNYKLSNLDDFIYKPVQENIFTKKEQKYIKTKKTIKVCVHPNQTPFVVLDKSVSGLSIDFLNYISKQTGLNYTIVKAKSHKEHLEMLKDGLCDIVPAVLTKPNKFDFLIPTYPVVKDNIVFATKLKESYIDDLHELKNKKIGIQKGTKSLQNYVKSKYPNLNLIEIEGYDMSKIINDEFYGYIGPSYQIMFNIIKGYSSEIKIMTRVGDKKIEGSFGVTNREPILLSILNKSIVNIPLEEKQKLQQNWKSIEIVKSFNYKLYYKMIGIFLFLFLIVTIVVVILRNNNKKLQQLLNSTMESVTIFKNGKVVRTNKASYEMFGYSSSRDMEDKTYFDFVHPSQHDFLKKQLKKSQKPCELLMLRKDGSTFPGLVRGTFIGKNMRVTSVIDLSELKNTQKKLEKLNIELKERVKTEIEKNRQQELMLMQQSRLARMGEMISMIAHQWRQPLNILSMQIQGAIFKYKKGSLNDEFVDKIEENSKNQISQMSETIDEFRNFFKPEKEKVEFNISQEVEKSVKLIAPMLAQEKIVLSIDLDKNIKLYGYPHEFGQTLINILNNAKDAFVTCSNNTKKMITIKLKVDEKIVLSIQDNAGGIPKEIIEDIFNPYFSTKDAKNGTGLGLYMSKIIIEEHMNGRLSVQNINKGAQFKIEFEVNA
jgi:PAS domain S-box-containing protein